MGDHSGADIITSAPRAEKISINLDTRRQSEVSKIHDIRPGFLLLPPRHHADLGFSEQNHQIYVRAFCHLVSWFKKHFISVSWRITTSDGGGAVGGNMMYNGGGD